MSVLTVKPKFLYPYSRQFPFDEVAEKIVKAMEKRNWKVPGITVEFDTYGSGETKYKMVSKIKGDNFELFFCREQGRLNKTWNDTAALCRVHIPKQSIEVFEDESGPRYYLYVGKNWEEDKTWFINSIKVHSKLNKEPRRYLCYKGNTYNSRAIELVYDNDLGREYSPIGSEPRKINLEQKFKEFASWLEEFVLGYILNFPEENVVEEYIAELIPYKGPWTTVFSLCDEKDAERILQGKENPNKLPLQDRHAYFGTGHRLVPLDVSCEGGFPEIARDGFIWCDVNPNINQNSKTNEISRCVDLEMRALFGKNYIVAVRLKYANDVYVADNAKYEETRHQLFEVIAPRDILTDEEFGEALAARGTTIVPITEYKGDYKEPIVLINRELDFEEIEWLVEAK
ncbi:MAG: hypothetical protein IJE68_04160 [Clostridia bacterium]|nr:hypothetical protein [Clostridia bacterium]